MDQTPRNSGEESGLVVYDVEKTRHGRVLKKGLRPRAVLEEEEYQKVRSSMLLSLSAPS